MMATKWVLGLLQYANLNRSSVPNKKRGEEYFIAWRLICEKPSGTAVTVKRLAGRSKNLMDLTGLLDQEEPFRALDKQNETVETVPALYFVSEILSIRQCSMEEIREIHKAKVVYPGLWINQD